MTGRLLLLAIVSLAAAGAAGVATAAAIVTIPELVAHPAMMAEPDKMLAPGSVSLMGIVVALAYGLMRPRRQPVRRGEARQARATDRLPCASMAIASTTPDIARAAATH